MATAKKDKVSNVQISFVKERETKNKTRFKEEADGEPAIGILYVTKKKLAEMGNPDTLHMTLTAV